MPASCCDCSASQPLYASSICLNMSRTAAWNWGTIRPVNCSWKALLSCWLTALLTAAPSERCSAACMAWPPSSAGSAEASAACTLAAVVLPTACTTWRACSREMSDTLAVSAVVMAAAVSASCFSTSVPCEAQGKKVVSMPGTGRGELVPHACQCV